MAPSTVRVLENIGRTPAPEFGQALEAVYEGRYTGSILVHFIEGVAKKFEIPQAVTIQLARGPRRTK